GGMILYGGSDGFAYHQETYVLSLEHDPAWIPLRTPGNTPSPRNGHVAVYDPDVPRMLVFGGDSGSSMAPANPYALDLSGGIPLDVGVNDPALGTVTQSPATSCHVPGEKLDLTAVPRDGYQFVEWTGDAGGAGNPVSVVMDG